MLFRFMIFQSVLRSTRPGLLLLAAMLSVLATACSGNSSPEARSTVGLKYSEREMVALAECLTAKGWELDFDEEFYTFEASIPPSQRAAFQRDEAECRQSWRKENPEPVATRDDYKLLYQKELAAAECLKKIGYLPLREPMSEQEYVDAMVNSRPPEWYAYMVVGAADEDDFNEVQRQCPQPSLDD